MQSDAGRTRSPTSRAQPTLPETPRWTLLSATAAPLLLIGGWTLGASRQSTQFDSFSDTISALAGRGADDRWIMTCALYGLGVCHVLTAVGLRSAAVGGRRVLGFGGCCTFGVASLPLPASSVDSATGHLAFATAAFVCLTAWPLFAFRRGFSMPMVLRARVSVVASAVLAGLLAWLALTLRERVHVGLAERVTAAAQALWPLAAVIATRRHCYGVD